MTDERLTIGELAKATGVATSALRYWEELGLLPAPDRVSGQRRYPASAAGSVGMILLLRDAGFTLRELKMLIGAFPDGTDAWHDLARRKLAELEATIAQAQAAHTAIAHALSCRHDDIRSCLTFSGLVAVRLSGTPLQQAHPS